MLKVMDKTNERKLTRIHIAKQMGNSSSTIESYRNDLNVNSMNKWKKNEKNSQISSATSCHMKGGENFSKNQNCLVKNYDEVFNFN